LYAASNINEHVGALILPIEEQIDFGYHAEEGKMSNILVSTALV
jgi:hypothetical protein